MRDFFDSVDANGIPATATRMAGYISGKPEWQSYWPMRERFPNAQVLSIATSPEFDADIADCEAGDLTPAQCPDWSDRQYLNGKIPWVYMSLSAWAGVRSFYAGRMEPIWWVANYNKGATMPPGASALQFADMGPYDQSIILDYIPGFDPIPEPPTSKDYDEMRFWRKASSGLIVWSEGGHVRGMNPGEWSTYVNLGYQIRANLEDGPFTATIDVESCADQSEATDVAAIMAQFAAHEAEWKAIFNTPANPVTPPTPTPGLVSPAMTGKSITVPPDIPPIPPNIPAGKRAVHNPLTNLWELIDHKDEGK